MQPLETCNLQNRATLKIVQSLETCNPQKRATLRIVQPSELQPLHDQMQASKLLHVLFCYAGFLPAISPCTMDGAAAHTHAPTHMLAHTHIDTHTQTHTHTQTQTHTDTHTHTQTPSPPSPALTPSRLSGCETTTQPAVATRHQTCHVDTAGPCTAPHLTCAPTRKCLQMHTQTSNSYRHKLTTLNKTDCSQGFGLE